MRRLFFSFAALVAVSGLSSASTGAEPVRYTSFEMRGLSSDPKADGETDFKGATAVWSTEERVAFLNAYADYAAARFGAPGLDRKAVTDSEIAARIAAIKPLPLPGVRTTLHLDEGWKQAAGVSEIRKRRPRPWRDIPGAVVKDGALRLPAGSHALLDLAQSTGWRYEVSWTVGGSTDFVGTELRFRFGENPLPAAIVHPGRYRLQVDLEGRRAYLSRDGNRVADFPFTPPASGQPAPLRVVTGAPLALSDLVFIDYVDRRKLVGTKGEVVLPGGMPSPNKADKQPYEPFVIADDDFRDTPDLTDWTTPNYAAVAWSPATLPCVHGGFREAGEALFLLRDFDLPVGKRFVLEVEAIDPSGEIYVNGALAAKIPDRRPVSLDITSFVRPGRNRIAFKVDPNFTPDLVGHAMLDRNTGWFAGRVALHALPDAVSIGKLLVHTGEFSTGTRSASQIHRAELVNTGDTRFSGFLEIACRPWFPKDGPVVATVRVPVNVPAHGVAAPRVELILKDATPWTPEAPFLYRVDATLTAGDGRALDGFVTTAGVRTVAQKDGKLLLNGEPALLIGAQNMGMRPVPFLENSSKYNRCATPEMLMGEMLAIKNAGNNLFRVHVHSALNKTGGINDPRIAEMADQIGLALFWTGPAWIREGDEHSVDTEHVGDYIRQVYNHPCIIDWELGNHPNAFDRDRSPVARTDEFVRKTVRAVLAVDDSRLITPTTFWSHTHYGNDAGTRDWKGRPIVAVPEYTHPLVTRGSQDAVTGYGADWSVLRRWPSGKAKDCLENGVRPWFNFEHEESAAQPNHALSAGYPWHGLRSYEIGYDAGSVGRTLGTDEWRASQAWQAFSAYESMRKQIFHGVAGFSWCTIEGGANAGTYEKPLLDPFGNAKLAWYVRKMLCFPVVAGSRDADTVYGPHDGIAPSLLNVGPERVVDLRVVVKSPDGTVADTRDYVGVKLPAGLIRVDLPAFRPTFPAGPRCVVEYRVTGR